MSDEEKVVPMNRDKTMMEMLDQWLRDLIFPGQTKDFIEHKAGHGTGDGEVKREFCLYTNDHQYRFVAVERRGEDGYLGCIASTRKNRAGENWPRGNDLPDGDFTEKTWNRILNAILNYELIKLSTYKKPDSVPEDTA